MIASKTFTQCSAVVEPWAVDVYLTEDGENVRIGGCIRHPGFKFGRYELSETHLRRCDARAFAWSVESAINNQAAYHPNRHHPMYCIERDRDALRMDIELWVDELARYGELPYTFSRATFFYDPSQDALA